MKKIRFFLILVCVLFFKNISAQSLVELNEDSIIYNMTPAVQEELRNLWPAPQNVKWSRQIERRIFFEDPADPNKVFANNIILQYPDEPVTNYIDENGVRKLTVKQNLFYLIMRLVKDGRVTAYSTDIRGRLSFSKKDIVSVDAKNPNLKDRSIKDMDINEFNRDLKGYAIKESWYFDAEASEFRSQIIAIAPLLDVNKVQGGNNITPLFWLTYDSILPWLMSYNTVPSENNNSDIITFDAYFRRRLFRGGITMFENPQNKTIDELCGACCSGNLEDCVKNKIGDIERQIYEFDQKQLWVKPIVIEKQKGKGAKKAKATTTASTKTAVDSKTKDKK